MTEPSQAQAAPTPGHGERRATVRALHHWSALKGERDWPARAQVRCAEAGLLGPHLFVVDAGEEPDEARFAEAGTQLAQFCGKPLAGQTVASTLPTALWEKWRYCFRVVLDLKKPLAASDILPVLGLGEIAYRGMLMPLADADERISCLLGAFSYKRMRYH